MNNHGLHAVLHGDVPFKVQATVGEQGEIEERDRTRLVAQIHLIEDTVDGALLCNAGLIVLNDNRVGQDALVGIRGPHDIEAGINDFLLGLLREQGLGGAAARVELFDEIGIHLGRIEDDVDVGEPHCDVVVEQSLDHEAFSVGDGRVRLVEPFRKARRQFLVIPALGNQHDVAGVAVGGHFIDELLVDGEDEVLVGQVRAFEGLDPIECVFGHARVGHRGQQHLVLLFLLHIAVDDANHVWAEGLELLGLPRICLGGCRVDLDEVFFFGCIVVGISQIGIDGVG